MKNVMICLLLLLDVIAYSNFSITNDGLSSLNSQFGDCLDPAIPNGLQSTIAFDEIQDFNFPYLDANTQSTFVSVYFEYDSISLEDEMVLLVTVENEYVETTYTEVMTEFGNYTFTYPIDFGDQISVISSSGGVGASAVVYNCDLDEPVFDGYIGNGGLIWQGDANCDPFPFYGSWEVCGDSEGSFSNNGEFQSTFTPSTLGMYTLCFTSECTNTVYEFDLNFGIGGCSNELACNYDSGIDLDFDDGSCYYNCDNCYFGQGAGIFIPDNQTECLELTIPIVDTSGATIEAIDDIKGLYVNMEHSHLGDLVISFICPNGQSMSVHQQGASGTFVGDPVDDEFIPEIAGECFSYWWTPTASLGTWAEESIGITNLWEGDYSSIDPWSDLYGCPINGDWSIEICDNIGSDNGYICSWGLAFSGSFNLENCIGDFVEGCTDPLACNFDPEIEFDDSGCDYEDCIIIENNTTTEGYCDSTYVTINFTELYPDSASFTLEIAGEEVPINETDTVDFWLYDVGYNYLLVHAVLSENQLEDEVKNVGQVIVYETLDQPIITNLGNTISCTNCNTFDPHWYFNGEYVGQSNNYESNNSGLVYACISHDVDPFCETCSTEMNFVVGVEEIKHSHVSLLNNGSEHVTFIAHVHGDLLMYNARGQLILSQKVRENEELIFDDYPAGLYILKLGSIVWRMEIIR